MDQQQNANQDVPVTRENSLTVAVGNQLLAEFPVNVGMNQEQSQLAGARVADLRTQVNRVFDAFLLALQAQWRNPETNQELLEAVLHPTARFTRMVPNALRLEAPPSYPPTSGSNFAGPSQPATRIQERQVHGVPSRAHQDTRRGQQGQRDHMGNQARPDHSQQTINSLVRERMYQDALQQQQTQHQSHRPAAAAQMQPAMHRPFQQPVNFTTQQGPNPQPYPMRANHAPQHNQPQIVEVSATTASRAHASQQPSPHHLHGQPVYYRTPEVHYPAPPPQVPSQPNPKGNPPGYQTFPMRQMPGPSQQPHAAAPPQQHANGQFYHPNPHMQGPPPVMDGRGVGVPHAAPPPSTGRQLPSGTNHSPLLDGSVAALLGQSGRVLAGQRTPGNPPVHQQHITIPPALVGSSVSQQQPAPQQQAPLQQQTTQQWQHIMPPGLRTPPPQPQPPLPTISPGKQFADLIRFALPKRKRDDEVGSDSSAATKRPKTVTPIVTSQEQVSLQNVASAQAPSNPAMKQNPTVDKLTELPSITPHFDGLRDTSAHGAPNRGVGPNPSPSSGQTPPVQKQSIAVSGPGADAQKAIKPPDTAQIAPADPIDDEISVISILPRLPTPLARSNSRNGSPVLPDKVPQPLFLPSSSPPTPSDELAASPAIQPPSPPPHDPPQDSLISERIGALSTAKKSVGDYSNGTLTVNPRPPTVPLDSSSGSNEVPAARSRWNEKLPGPKRQLVPYVLVPPPSRSFAALRKHREGLVRDHDVSEAERARTLLRAHVCHWRGCNAILDSTERQTAHVWVNHVTQDERGRFLCKWQTCQKIFKDRINLRRHLKEDHLVAGYPCSYSDCDKWSQTPELHTLHRKHTPHEGMAVRAEAKPGSFPPLALRPLPQLPNRLQTFMIAVQVRARPIPPDVHERIGPWVLRRIHGQGSPVRQRNAASPMRRIQRPSIETTAPETDEVMDAEFLFLRETTAEVGAPSFCDDLELEQEEEDYDGPERSTRPEEAHVEQLLLME